MLKDSLRNVLIFSVPGMPLTEMEKHNTNKDAFGRKIPDHSKDLPKKVLVATEILKGLSLFLTLVYVANQSISTTPELDQQTALISFLGFLLNGAASTINYNLNFHPDIKQ